jgi:hypothetical protein
VNPVDELAILKARRLALEKTDGYSNAVVTNTSSSLRLLAADPTINLDGYSDAVVTNASSSLRLPTADHTTNLDAANDNLAVETQQVRIITDKTSITTMMEEYLSSSIPEIVREVSHNLFAAPPTL